MSKRRKMSHPCRYFRETTLVEESNEERQFSTTTTTTTITTTTTTTSPTKLGDDFFDLPCQELAVKLLGKKLVRILDDGTRLSGEIVETECYLGGDDMASHSYGGKKTERNTAMFMKPGTAYVYIIYGMYNCFNISSRGDGSAVLIRSLRPIEGMDVMRRHRNLSRKTEGYKPLKITQLCNGPSKLCQSLKIDKAATNMKDLGTLDWLWLEQETAIDPAMIVTSHRIGVTSAGEEWANKPLRFYMLNNAFVSIRDKHAEAVLIDAINAFNGN